MLQQALDKLRIRWWRRSQFTNLALREHFRRHHRVEVGLYSYGCFDQWRMPGPIRIGRYCSIANSVRSAPVNHPLDTITTHPMLYEKRFGVVPEDWHYTDTLVIEDDVWIGHNCVILPGCRHIGRGAVIGAGAIVTRDVPAYAIVAGNPARKLRDRFSPEMIASLEASRWWEREPQELARWNAACPNVLHHPNVESLARVAAA